jgi:hypothetical protein
LSATTGGLKRVPSDAAGTERVDGQAVTLFNANLRRKAIKVMAMRIDSENLALGILRVNGINKIKQATEWIACDRKWALRLAAIQRNSDYLQ